MAKNMNILHALQVSLFNNKVNKWLCFWNVKADTFHGSFGKSGASIFKNSQGVLTLKFSLNNLWVVQNFSNAFITDHFIILFYKYKFKRFCLAFFKSFC